MGLRRRSIEQAGVLLNGAARLAIAVLVLMLVLAPWGIEFERSHVLLRAAFFGFQVGDVTISLSAIVSRLALWRRLRGNQDRAALARHHVPAGDRTRCGSAQLDPHRLRLCGLIAAGAIAFSYLGLSLDRIAIVAGALSVGIGFGLQSIVYNFVSGLILLWERPIRVGDLVVVGDGEGYVRRISVRATEIETFDRSTVVVPNSNLISGVVRNRVRTDRTGRVIVNVPVPRASDPDQVAEIMRTCALAHREVMSEPGPRVLFRKITDASIEFDLVCFVDEIETCGRVSSDLYFAIYRCLRQAGIGSPAPAATAVTLQGLDRVEEQLEHIAEAIELEHKPAGSQPHRAIERPLPVPAMKPRMPSDRKPKSKPAQ